jgi:hypothetical protein
MIRCSLAEVVGSPLSDNGRIFAPWNVQPYIRVGGPIFRHEQPLARRWWAKREPGNHSPVNNGYATSRQTPRCDGIDDFIPRDQPTLKEGHNFLYMLNLSG